MTEKQILARIRKLDAELSTEIKKLESTGHTIASIYNKVTGKDELHIANK